MRINLSRLTANLPQREEYQQRYTPGLFRAIEAAHFETNSASIDWNGFTLAEAQQALDMAMNYVDTEYVEEMDGSPNEGNAIHEFLHNNEFIYHFKRAKPMPSEDVDFF
ncbi:hypothetical protein [Paenibacillus ihuae]|uniref:hypothetical protein n=1 Tax=Paenibacillus ihuae TaxID=1232431 RepID=UPI0006D5A35A|nr:hypothetical protein [Paenibacillus ihuae]